MSIFVLLSTHFWYLNELHWRNDLPTKWITRSLSTRMQSSRTCARCYWWTLTPALAIHETTVSVAVIMSSRCFRTALVHLPRLRSRLLSKLVWDGGISSSSVVYKLYVVLGAWCISKRIMITLIYSVSWTTIPTSLEENIWRWTYRWIPAADLFYVNYFVTWTWYKLRDSWWLKKWREGVQG